MARCPECNKFVSYDEPEVEVEELEIFDGRLVGSIRVVLLCAESGTELKECNLDIDEKCECEQCHGGDINVESDAEGTEFKKKGKMHYGGIVRASLECQDCNCEWDKEITVV